MLLLVLPQDTCSTKVKRQSHFNQCGQQQNYHVFLLAIISISHGNLVVSEVNAQIWESGSTVMGREIRADS